MLSYAVPVVRYPPSNIDIREDSENPNCKSWTPLHTISIVLWEIYLKSNSNTLFLNRLHKDYFTQIRFTSNPLTLESTLLSTSWADAENTGLSIPLPMLDILHTQKLGFEASRAAVKLNTARNWPETLNRISITWVVSIYLAMIRSCNCLISWDISICHY